LPVGNILNLLFSIFANIKTKGVPKIKLNGIVGFNLLIVSCLGVIILSK